MRSSLRLVTGLVRGGETRVVRRGAGSSSGPHRTDLFQGTSSSSPPPLSTTSLMDVEGRAPDGKRYRVEVGAQDSVKSLKRRLEEAAGVGVGRVRFGDRQLKEGELCSDAGLVAECVVDF
eukprot:Sspe_Gene.109792::Locus_89952_Transcript_3_4_Confidence_0.333_Length_402::g.109792::m.109792